MLGHRRDGVDQAIYLQPHDFDGELRRVFDQRFGGGFIGGRGRCLHGVIIAVGGICRKYVGKCGFLRIIVGFAALAGRNPLVTFVAMGSMEGVE